MLTQLKFQILTYSMNNTTQRLYHLTLFTIIITMIILLFHYLLTVFQMWSYHLVVIVELKGVLIVFYLENHFFALLPVSESTQVIAKSFPIIVRRRSLALLRDVNILSVTVQSQQVPHRTWFTRFGLTMDQFVLFLTKSCELFLQNRPIASGCDG